MKYAAVVCERAKEGHLKKQQTIGIVCYLREIESGHHQHQTATTTKEVSRLQITQSIEICHSLHSLREDKINYGWAVIFCFVGVPFL